MNDNTTTSIIFEEVNYCPKNIDLDRSIEKSAINAVAIITGKAWRDLVKCLIAQAHLRGNMPTYKTCLTDMIRANGFVPMSNACSIKEVIQMLNDSFSVDEQYLVKLGAGYYYAIVPDKIKGQYVLKGDRCGRAIFERRWIDEIWRYVPGTDNRTGIVRKARKSTMPSESDKFTAKNLNPDGRRIGDCVIRALSAVYECTWHEAIDYIADATLYEDPVLNSTPNINTTLIKLGFERHKGIKNGGRFYTGIQLCEHLNRIYHDGERIFAYVGRSHCAAIVPVEENGHFNYKVQDTWDSTAKGISEYWVFKKPRQEDDNIQESELQYTEGSCIHHPKYGEGKIVASIGSGHNIILEICFKTVGNKKISEAWLRSQKIKNSEVI